LKSGEVPNSDLTITVGLGFNPEDAYLGYQWISTWGEAIALIGDIHISSARITERVLSLSASLICE